MMRFKQSAFGLVCMMSATAFAHTSCESTELNDYMEDLKTELKSFSFDVKTGDMTSAQKRIQPMIDLLSKSREETPYLFVEKKLEGEELATRQAQYQKGIDATINKFEQIDNAIKTNDVASVKGLLSQVGKSRKKGHRAFKSEC